MIKEAEQRNITVLSPPILMEIMAMYLLGDLSNLGLITI